MLILAFVTRSQQPGAGKQQRDGHFACERADLWHAAEEPDPDLPRAERGGASSVLYPHNLLGCGCSFRSCVLGAAHGTVHKAGLPGAGSRAAAPRAEDERCRGHAAEDAAGVGVRRLRLHAAPGQNLLPVSDGAPCLVAVLLSLNPSLVLAWCMVVEGL